MSALPRHDMTAIGIIELASLVTACDASIASFTAHLDRPETSGKSAPSQILNAEIDQLQATKCQALRIIRKANPENRLEALERLRLLAIIELQNAGDMIELHDLARAEIHRAFDLASIQIEAQPNRKTL